MTQTLAVLLLAAPFAHGDMHKKGEMMKDEKTKQSAMMDSVDCCKMHAMHNKGPGKMGMMHRQVIATEDGGIVVVMGNMVMKYDAELSLVVKTRIEMSDEDMHHMMKQHERMMKMRDSQLD